MSGRRVIQVVVPDSESEGNSDQSTGPPAGPGAPSAEATVTSNPMASLMATTVDPTGLQSFFAGLNANYRLTRPGEVRPNQVPSLDMPLTSVPTFAELEQLRRVGLEFSQSTIYPDQDEVREKSMIYLDPSVYFKLHCGNDLAALRQFHASLHESLLADLQARLQLRRQGVETSDADLNEDEFASLERHEADSIVR